MSEPFGIIQLHSELKGQNTCCNLLHGEPFDAHHFGVLIIVFVAETCTNNARKPRSVLNRNGWPILSGISTLQEPSS